MAAKPGAAQGRPRCADDAERAGVSGRHAGHAARRARRGERQRRVRHPDPGKLCAHAAGREEPRAAQACGRDRAGRPAGRPEGADRQLRRAPYQEDRAGLADRRRAHAAQGAGRWRGPAVHAARVDDG
ncbi:hypothetical protein G6F32_016222 [Rhizopus arrhizus]|nr:hypothetical protein G6F32_016222 [Rhizopus arrhizus]